MRTLVKFIFAFCFLVSCNSNQNTSIQEQESNYYKPDIVCDLQIVSVSKTDSSITIFNAGPDSLMEADIQIGWREGFYTKPSCFNHGFRPFSASITYLSPNDSLLIKINGSIEDSAFFMIDPRNYVNETNENNNCSFGDGRQVSKCLREM